MIEIFKTKSQFNPDFTTAIFEDMIVSYRVRRGTDALLPNVKITTNEIKMV